MQVICRLLNKVKVNVNSLPSKRLPSKKEPPTLHSRNCFFESQQEVALDRLGRNNQSIGLFPLCPCSYGSTPDSTLTVASAATIPEREGAHKCSRWSS